MGNNDYDYDYHHLAEDAEYIDEDENNTEDEFWNGLDADEDIIMDEISWENYYHNLADEIVNDD